MPVTLHREGSEQTRLFYVCRGVVLYHARSCQIMHSTHSASKSTPWSLPRPSTPVAATSPSPPAARATPRPRCPRASPPRSVDPPDGTSPSILGNVAPRGTTRARPRRRRCRVRRGFRRQPFVGPPSTVTGLRRRLLAMEGPARVLRRKRRLEFEYELRGIEYPLISARPGIHGANGWVRGRVGGLGSVAGAYLRLSGARRGYIKRNARLLAAATGLVMCSMMVTQLLPGALPQKDLPAARTARKARTAWSFLLRGDSTSATRGASRPTSPRRTIRPPNPTPREAG